MLDEIDKLGKDYRGDPSQLAGDLDPQRTAVQGTLFDFAFDLFKGLLYRDCESGVRFRRALDRMELSIWPLQHTEKLQIASAIWATSDNGKRLPRALQISDDAFGIDCRAVQRASWCPPLDERRASGRKVALRSPKVKLRGVTSVAAQISEYLGRRGLSRAGAQGTAGVATECHGRKWAGKFFLERHSYGAAGD